MSKKKNFFFSFYVSIYMLAVFQISVDLKAPFQSYSYFSEACNILLVFEEDWKVSGDRKASGGR